MIPTINLFKNILPKFFLHLLNVCVSKCNKYSVLMTHQWPSRQTNDLFQHLFIFLLVEWLTQSSIVHNQTSFSHCMDNLMVCISTSFHVQHATNTWSKYFFQNCFQTSILLLNCFFIFVIYISTKSKKNANFFCFFYLKMCKTILKSSEGVPNFQV